MSHSSTQALKQRVGRNFPILLVVSVAVVSPLFGCDTQPSAPQQLVLHGEAVDVSIPYRNIPRRIAETSGLEDAVTEDELLAVVSSALPLWNPPTVPTLMHELRLWGTKSSFSPEMVGRQKSGSLMSEILLSNSLAREFTVGGDDYLVKSPYGIKVLQNGTDENSGMRGQGHFAQLLAVLAEAGVPLSRSVSVATGDVGTVADLLDDALMYYQAIDEQEWIAVAALSYLAPGVTAWRDRFNERQDIEAIAERLMSIPLERSACFGCHVPYALMFIYRADRQDPFLSDPTRQSLSNWFLRLKARLQLSELPNGGWDKSWLSVPEMPTVAGNEVIDRITITGHHLEWMTFAPAELRPELNSIRRAVKTLVGDIESLGWPRSFKTQLPCTHAARALCRMSHRDPYEVWQLGWNSGVEFTSRGYRKKRVDSASQSIP